MRCTWLSGDQGLECCSPVAKFLSPGCGSGRVKRLLTLADRDRADKWVGRIQRFHRLLDPQMISCDFTAL
jgi:hypothetical protein